MPFLELEGGTELTDNPREFDGALAVGSGSLVDWRIQRRDLAARHFRVELAGIIPIVLPAPSQNVIALNGRQVPTGGADLHPGDVISAGSARFVYLESRDEERPAPPEEPPQALLVNTAARKAYTMR